MTFKCSNCSDPIEITEADLLALEKENVFARNIRRGEATLICRKCSTGSLKPCPFCGRNDQSQGSVSAGHGAADATVECRCGVTMAAQTPQEARDRWNRRV